MEEKSTVFVSGYTQAPKGTKLYESGSILGVMFVIDIQSHKILDAECTFITHIAQKYFKELLVGYNFKNDLKEISAVIEKHLIIPSAHSIIVAVKIAHQRYIDSIVKGK